MAFAARDQRLGTSDVFVHEFERDLTRRLTDDRGTENGPLWTPDGKAIVFAADRHGPPNLHARNADGTGAEREVVAPAMGPLSGGSILPDGQSIVFVRQSPTRFERRIVQLGRRSGDVVEVLSGLTDGQTVVGKGSFYLKTALLRERIGDEH